MLFGYLILAMMLFYAGELPQLNRLKHYQHIKPVCIQATDLSRCALSNIDHLPRSTDFHEPGI